MPRVDRTVAWFSCGAPSAVAARLAIDASPPGSVVVAYCDTSRREHPDNARFLADVEAWLGQPIERPINARYAGDPDQVFVKERFLVGPRGAKCTSVLKKEVRWAFQRPYDRVVLGFTVEEYEARQKRLAQAEPMANFWPILAERGITRGDCMRIIAEAGIELPAMYRLGYRNNNCVGCVKGGIGYWNKVRVDFPERFAEMAAIERRLKRQVLSVRKKGEPRRRVYLDELDPTLGRYDSEPDISCGILCESGNAST